MNVSLQVHRVETTLTQNGTLTLDHLPFQAGEAVEVIVMPNKLVPLSTDLYPLRGTPLQYDEPMGSVAEEDWEALSCLPVLTGDDGP